MAGNMFLKFEGPEVEGESADTRHTDQIEVLSWSHSFNQPTSATRVSAGSGTVEKASHADFNFSKYLDASTDDLLKLCWSGKQIDKCTFYAYRADGDNEPVLYLQIEMEKVIVANMSISGGVGDIPIENIALNYAIVKYIYKRQKTDDGSADGDQPVSHDLMKQEVA